MIDILSTFFKKVTPAAAICLSVMTGTPVMADEAKPFNPLDPINEPIKDIGKFGLDLRLGYEWNDSDIEGKDTAKALSLRSRLSFKSVDFAGFSAFLQLQNNWNLVDDFYSPNGYGDTSHSVIADPPGTRLHQGYIDYKGIEDTTIRIGYQEIIFDDARLIGNVGWRNNAQSFSALRVTNKSIDDLTLDLVYASEIHNIFNNDDLDLNHLIMAHADYKFSDAVNAAAFAYLLDSEGDSRDSGTYGLRLYGKNEGFSYDTTLATQRDYADGKDHNGWFFSGDVKQKLGKVTAGLGYQYISGGEGTDKFDTLFGTAHKFNGWADQFLGTGSPSALPGGLQDMYATLGTKLGGTKFTTAYHLYHTAESTGAFSGWYGQEFNIVAARKLTDNLTLLLKYAIYDEMQSEPTYDDAKKAFVDANPTFDEQVFWVRLNLTY